MQVRTQVDVEAAAPTVLAAVTDIESWPEWTKSITTAQWLDEGPLRVGRRARVKQPRMPEMVWEVSRFDPGRGFEWTTSSPGVVTTGGHWVAPSPTGTSLIVELEQHGPLAALVGWLLGARTRRYVQLEADGMKACSEDAVRQVP